jgi:hypothetical protein
MKQKSITTRGCALLSICAALFIFTACSTTSAPPATPAAETNSSSPVENSVALLEEGVPGGIIVSTAEVTARVVALDSANRKATLEGPEGKQFDVKAGPQAVNFDQVQVGDLLKVVLTEELAIYLGKAGDTLPDGSTEMVALAPKGAQPGGVVAGITQVTATIKIINYTTRTATLQFADGSSKTISVRDDIDLSQHRAGEKVVFRITEMVAITVEKL